MLEGLNISMRVNLIRVSWLLIERNIELLQINEVQIQHDTLGSGHKVQEPGECLV